MSLRRVPDVEERLCPKCGMLQESPGSTVCEQCGADLIESEQTAPVVSLAPPAISTPRSQAIFSPPSQAISPPPPQAVSSAPRLKVNWSRRPVVPPSVVTMQRLALFLNVFVRRNGPILVALVRRIGPITVALVRRTGPILVAPIRALVAIPLMLLRAIVVVVHRVLSAILQTVLLTLRTAAVVLVVGSLVIGLSYVPAVRAALPITKEVTARADPWLQRAEGLGGRLLAQLQRSVQLRRSSERSPAARTAGPARPTGPPKTGASSRRAPSQVSLAIRSTPPGATVLLNQRRAGKAPLTIKVAPGTYRLTLSHPGYLSATRTITVKAGQPISLDVVLSQPP